jgi:hypothetical protein
MKKLLELDELGIEGWVFILTRMSQKSSLFLECSTSFYLSVTKMFNYKRIT